ncbi:Phosphatidylethanolamine-binding protein F40A3.3 [Thelohanellus kitauei]|uniref:Phosphatidylethanolamine-binding protein F40A3.3 n=1 Tax=Thelohanellus kitauei TaxID=669202 RepID=A0A0C2N0K0_THEKT|nr:Phosphatidylethanolamine-binding protein F40A3.3 [Thelohanellus kitauei]
MTTEKIFLPELGDVCRVVPLETVNVAYGTTPMTFGSTLTPTDVKDKPKLSWTANYQKYYTLIMTDPDAPSREDPKFREWLHWLVVNIPGDHVDQGEECFGYVGAGPPKGTSFHRYIFLVYEQRNKIEFLETKRSSTDSRDRPCQKAAKIAEKYHLGEPMFINFFLAEYDDYVPKLYKTLKD